MLQRLYQLYLRCHDHSSTLQERCICTLVTLLPVDMNHNVKKAVYNPRRAMESTNQVE